MEQRTKRRQRNPLLRKGDILAAAQQVFSRRGYAEAGIREIAEAAGGISSSLLLHYFGSKADLFEAALIDMLERSPVFTFDRASFGEQFVAYVMHGIEGPTLATMIALSTGNDEARAITARFAQHFAIDRLADWLGGADAHARALSISIISLGLGIYGRELPLDPPPETLAWAAQTIQRIVDQS
jgi:AcrR family transcriptional regulator